MVAELQDDSLRTFLEDFIRDFLTQPENNNLGPDCGEPAWEKFVLGFSRADDPLYDFLKEHIGEDHWTPAEAFALGSPECSTPPSSQELTVVSWALSQTEKTKAANRGQTRYPAEVWARARSYGQRCQRKLQRALVEALAGLGCQAVAPSLLREHRETESPWLGRASNWSERHVAYTSGLGTFGLCGGLITELGQAVRLGSLVVRAHITPSPRPAGGPFAHCLFYRDGSCSACADRCPAGSVSPEGRDKEACARHVQNYAADFIRRKYELDSSGCGLCQTAVPCESQIPQVG